MYINALVCSLLEYDREVNQNMDTKLAVNTVRSEGIYSIFFGVEYPTLEATVFEDKLLRMVSPSI